MSSSKRPSVVNSLIEALPSRDRRRVLAECEMVHLVRGEELQNACGRLAHIFFPTSGFIALIMTIDGTAALEVGLIGNEGACGYQLALGVDRSGVQAVVRGGGSALRMSSDSFAGQLAASRPLVRLMGQYVNVQLNQLAQLVACTRFHVVEERLARLLLLTQDRGGSETLLLTHQLLGSILGVRRVGITKAAGALQARGLIHYSRGRITVLDRRGLRKASCGCYEADRKSYAQVLE